MTQFRRLLRRKRFWAGFAFVVYSLLGFFVAPKVVRSQAVKAIEEQLGRTAVIETVRVNPYIFSLAVRGFALKDPDGTAFVTFDEFYADLQLSSLVRRAWTFRELRLDNPRVNVRLMPDERPNFVDIIERMEASRPEGPPPDEPPGIVRLIVGDLMVNDARMKATNLAAPEPEEVDFTPVDFHLIDFSTLPERNGDYTLSATGIGGGSWNWEGTLQFEPLVSEGSFTLADTDLTRVWEVARNRVEFEVREGQLSLRLDYRFAVRGDSILASISDGTVRVEQLALREKGVEPQLLSIDSLMVSGVELRYPAQTLAVDEVAVTGADFTGWMTEEGEFNWLALFPSAPDTGATPGAPVWVATIRELLLRNCSVHFEDRMTTPVFAVDVDPVDLQVTSISSEPGAQFGLAGTVTIAGQGQLSVDGPVSARPPGADLKVQLSRLPLPIFQPYLSPMARLELIQGTLEVDGRLQVAQPDPALLPELRFAGNISSRDVETRDTIEGERFAAWQSVELREVLYDPGQLSVSEIVATRPYARVIVHEDRTTNLMEVLVPQDSTLATTPAAGAAQPVLPMRIGVVRILDGSADFADFSLILPFAAGMEELNGEVSGLSSDSGSRAQVVLDGAARPSGRAQVRGEINPLSDEVYSDVHVVFDDFDLPVLTPYAGQYIGREIDQGKMELDLNYRLEGRWLKGQNRVILDQLELGEDVDSPEATSLPVGLGVALLKDRNGRIDLDIEVEGDIDDPGFSLWDAITDVLWNLLTKAVTAPFKLLGALVGFGGDSDELSYAAYTPGESVLVAEEEDKLLKLAEALTERPQLRLEVRGSVDPEADAIALREARFQALIAQRTAADPAKYATSDSLPARLIRDLYTERFGNDALKERELLFRVPELDRDGSPRGDRTVVDEPALLQDLRQILVDLQTVANTDLRELALDRGRAVKRVLVDQGQVLETRIFLLDVDLEATTDAGTVKAELNLTS